MRLWQVHPRGCGTRYTDAAPDRVIEIQMAVAMSSHHSTSRSFNGIAKDLVAKDDRPEWQTTSLRAFPGS
ncbi:MAG: hypothetical protein QOI01_1078, partial [Mycobacterium sp.]|nr:hypothetical protein [Mycobacterium sp.]